MRRKDPRIMLVVALVTALGSCTQPRPQTGQATLAGDAHGTTDVTRPIIGFVTATHPTRLPLAARATPLDTPQHRESDASLPPTTSPQTPTNARTPPLAIEAFTVDAVELSDGRRRLTFAWRTRAASRVSLLLRTHHRFHPSWDRLPPDGTHVFVGDTLYPNPDASLIAYDAEGRSVSERIRLDWPCRYPSFFTADAEAGCPMPTDSLCSCPRHAAITTPAVEQPFENGRMIWFQGTHGEPSYPDAVIVLYEDMVQEGPPDLHQAAFYDESWTPDEVVRDPDLAPPSGLFWPAGGFARVWQTRASVRERLGWATGPAQAFQGVWQPLRSEYLGADAFFRTADGQLVFFSGWWMAGGTWAFVTP